MVFSVISGFELSRRRGETSTAGNGEDVFVWVAVDGLSGQLSPAAGLELLSCLRAPWDLYGSPSPIHM